MRKKIVKILTAEFVPNNSSEKLLDFTSFEVNIKRLAKK